MNGSSAGGIARPLDWWIKRNPTYLLSAACMAYGARLYLVDPSDEAGDLALILITLGALQAYEWAVGAVLILLHESKRSLEDLPSLMLVAALFWTGPLVATMEMTAQHADLGGLMAGGVCLIALVELALIHRVLGLKFSWSGRVTVAACLVLVAAVPPFLKVHTDVGGPDEIVLYAAWWLLAVVVLMAWLTVRRSCRADGRLGLSATELAFLGITVAVAVAHMVAMNHAFFANARGFYASAVMVAAAVVLFQAVRPVCDVTWWVVMLIAAVLPGVAVILGRGSFAAEFPVEALPVWLQEPLAVILLMAALAWWFGGVRHRLPVLFHMGNGAFVFGLYRLSRLVFSGESKPVSSPGLEMFCDNRVSLLFFVAAVYLLVSGLIRGNRREGALAVVFAVASVVTFDWPSESMGHFVGILTMGWGMLLLIHLLVERPGLFLRVWPVMLLVFVGWVYYFRDGMHAESLIHAGAMVVVLFVAGMIWRQTYYRAVAIAVAVVDFGVLGGDRLYGESHATATLVVLGAFGLLGVGTLISWYKGSLLVEAPCDGESRLSDPVQADFEDSMG